MTILLYPLFVLGSIFITAFSYLFANFFLAALADNGGNLPKYLSLFQTFDATLDEGCRARRLELASGNGTQIWATFNPFPANKWQVYINRWKWLQRNPAYGFDYKLFGLSWNPEEWTVKHFSEDEKRTLFIATSDYGFNIYYDGPYGMYKLGWKVWNHYNKETGMLTQPFGDNTRVPLCFTPNFFKHK